MNSFLANLGMPGPKGSARELEQRRLEGQKRLDARTFEEAQEAREECKHRDQRQKQGIIELSNLKQINVKRTKNVCFETTQLLLCLNLHKTNVWNFGNFPVPVSFEFVVHLHSSQELKFSVE